MPEEEAVGDDSADKDYSEPVQQLDTLFQKTRGVPDICKSGENNWRKKHSYLLSPLELSIVTYLHIIIPVMKIPLLGVPNIQDDINQKQFFARMSPVALKMQYFRLIRFLNLLYLPLEKQGQYGICLKATLESVKDKVECKHFVEKIKSSHFEYFHCYVGWKYCSNAANKSTKLTQSVA